MDAGVILRELTRSGRLSLRSLATRAATSHGTLSAYQSGRVSPSLTTLDRVVRTAGFDVETRLTRRVREDGGLSRGEELEAVLRLAAQFPARDKEPLVRVTFAP
jgi:transcriptional regulator with XRE-family HTH domain